MNHLEAKLSSLGDLLLRSECKYGVKKRGTAWHKILELLWSISII
jgi:hypothetical protein